MLIGIKDKQPTTNNQQQTTNNKQQTTNNKRQTTNDKQQTTFQIKQYQRYPFLLNLNLPTTHTVPETASPL
ncbi:MAG: hypothetical protein F6K47_21870 [Symploca sp. SIO2E6]|nr:hypothetical protein [Symploca sp. SIO2E6]